jgi:4-amino-4-deoxy-L-arabinose transferase-like glycosyltransferase
VLAARRNPDFLWFYFIHEHVLRYATPVAQREEPFWFFIPVLVLGLLPWSGLLPAAARQLRRGSLRQRPEVVFLTVWAGFVFLFFSASQSKLVPYVLPACLPLAVLLALTLDPSRLEDGRTRAWSRAGALVTAVVLAALALPFLWAAFGRVPIYSPAFSPVLFAFALPAFAAAVAAIVLWWSPRAAIGPRVSALALAALLFFGCIWAVGPRVGLARSTKDFARDLAVRLQPGDEVYAYRCYPQTLPVYLGRLINLVSHDGELNFGIEHLPPEEHARRFPGMDEFRPVWRSDRLVYLVLEARDLPRMPGDGLTPGPILVRSEKYLLMINRPAGSQPTPETP